jgi:hypothetical protein
MINQETSPREINELSISMPFCFGAWRRKGVESNLLFDAILAGERRALTRFQSWQDWKLWSIAKVGDQVRIYDSTDWWKSSSPCRWIDVTITAVNDINLDDCDDDTLSLWSLNEGWHNHYGRRLGEQHGPGRQIIFDPILPGHRRSLDGEISALVSAERSEDASAA